MDSFFRIPSISVFCGMPGSGKSTTMKYLAQKFFCNGAWQYVIVICSELYIQAYDWVPKDYKYTHYFPEIIYKLLLQQKEYIKKGEKVNCLLIFDDIGGYAEEFRRNILKKLVTEHKNANITIFISIQYMSMISSYVTSICNYGWIYALDSEQDMEACRKAFGGRYFVPDTKHPGQFKKAPLSAFTKFVQDNTKDHRIIVCDRGDKVNPYKYISHNIPDQDFRLAI